MQKLAVAAAVTALFGAALSAQQAARPGAARTPPPAPKMAVAHPSVTPGAGAATSPSSAATIEAQNKLVAQNCASCHSEKMKAGELVLAGFDAAKITDRPDVAEKMIRKLRAGMMPPPGARRPDAATTRAFLESLESRMDAAAALNPNPGWRPFQRLNRSEYQHAVKDLLGIDVDVTAFRPPDTISNGFDNGADVQAFSPTLMESYLRAASSISRLAVGDRGASNTSATYKIGRTGSQMRHVDGAPMGTRGGVSVLHTFPADGEYVVKVSLHNEPLGGIYGRTTMATMDIKEQIEVSVNGERAALLDLNVRMSETDPKNGLELKTPPLHIGAGPQRITAAFIQRFDGPVDDLLVPLENTLADVNISFGVTALPHMRDMTILGPFAVPRKAWLVRCFAISAAHVSSSMALVGRHVKIFRRLSVSDTPVTLDGPRIVMSRMCGSAVTPKLMLTSASVLSSGTSRSSSGPSNRWMNAAEMRCAPAEM